MINKYSKCDPVVGCGIIYPVNLSHCPKCGTPETFSDKIKADPSFYVYDLETYPNFFSMGLTHIVTGAYWEFEASDRKNELHLMEQTLNALAKCKANMIGYNNQFFDYPLIHLLLTRGARSLNYQTMYESAQEIIHSKERFANIVWPQDEIIKQIDLFKINHFDNQARSTSLKELEFNMESKNIIDLPYPVGSMLDDHAKDVTLNYQKNDVMETLKFALECMDKIQFRQELTEKLNKDFLKHNDTKIGKDFFIMELEKEHKGITKERVNGQKVVRQTKRDQIVLKDIIFNYINFSHPEFQRVKAWLEQQVITETKGVFTDLNAVVDGFKYDFGTGGIHGSVESATVLSDDEYAILDVDVASYYPNLAISNNLYPEHLGDTFCRIYKELYLQRKNYDKKQAENGMLKLALNGVYGDSNSQYSPFYDPAFTMSITINGQLLLCLLADYLRCVPNLTMIQINTDGLTFKIPRNQIPLAKELCSMWEKQTKLELEYVEYKRMFIRDVNSYIAEGVDGKLKRKGAYGHLTDYHKPNSREVEWHKDHSALIVPKAAEAVLVRGEDLETAIVNHGHDYDFMLRTKPPRSNKIIMEKEKATFDGMITEQVEHQRVTRFYVSKEGGYLFKIAPPILGMKLGDYCKKQGVSTTTYHKIMSEISPNTWDERIHTKNKSQYKERKTAYCKGWKVTECNDLETFDRSNVNYDYYIAEAKKLIDPIKSRVI